MKMLFGELLLAQSMESVSVRLPRKGATSLTVMVCVTVDLFPASSVAVQVLLIILMVGQVPGVSLFCTVITGVGSQASVAIGLLTGTVWLQFKVVSLGIF